MLEVCIDSLESAHNAIRGGADELEVCSSLSEGGLSPSPGLVIEVIKMVNDPCYIDSPLKSKPKVNVMVRCTGRSDFCYTEYEMQTMLADIEVYKGFGVDRIVFGALTASQGIDTVNCTRIVQKAYPIPVTFHRAFDLCTNHVKAIEDIIELGFTRLLMSGKQTSADHCKAIELLTFLLENYKNKIEIMPGAGVNCNNAHIFINRGFKIIHSSCKILKHIPVISDLCMGNDVIYVTDESIVREIKKIIQRS